MHQARKARPGQWSADAAGVVLCDVAGRYSLTRVDPRSSVSVVVSVEAAHRTVPILRSRMGSKG